MHSDHLLNAADAFLLADPPRVALLHSLLAGLGFWVYGSGFGVYGSGFEVYASGFGVYGSGFGVYGLGCLG